MQQAMAGEGKSLYSSPSVAPSDNGEGKGGGKSLYSSPGPAPSDKGDGERTGQEFIL